MGSYLQWKQDDDGLATDQIHICFTKVDLDALTKNHRRAGIELGFIMGAAFVAALYTVLHFI